MKNSIKHFLLPLVCGIAFISCEKQTTPEPVQIQRPELQSPIVRDDVYYARLRAYKKTDHKLAFGWFGSWTAINPSEQSRLRSAPDSMDIISILRREEPSMNTSSSISRKEKVCSALPIFRKPKSRQETFSCSFPVNGTAIIHRAQRDGRATGSDSRERISTTV